MGMLVDWQVLQLVCGFARPAPALRGCDFSDFAVAKVKPAGVWRTSDCWEPGCCILRLCEKCKRPQSTSESFLGATKLRRRGAIQRAFRFVRHWQTNCQWTQCQRHQWADVTSGFCFVFFMLSSWTDASLCSGTPCKPMWRHPLWVTRSERRTKLRRGQAPTLHRFMPVRSVH